MVRDKETRMEAVAFMSCIANKPSIFCTICTKTRYRAANCSQIIWFQEWWENPLETAPTILATEVAMAGDLEGAKEVAEALAEEEL